MYLKEAKLRQCLNCFDRLDNLILEHGDIDDALVSFDTYMEKYADGLSESSRAFMHEILKDYSRADILTLMMKFHKLLAIDLDAYEIYNVIDKRAHRKAVIIAVLQPLPNTDKWVEFFELEGLLK